MLTLWSYGGYARSEHPSLGKYLITLALFALGLICKPTLVTVPFVLLLLDYWPLRRLSFAGVDKTSSAGWKMEILEKIPFLLLTAASCVATLLAQQTVIETSFKPDLAQRIGNALVSYVTYLSETIYRYILRFSIPIAPVTRRFWPRSQPCWSCSLSPRSLSFGGSPIHFCSRAGFGSLECWFP